MPVASGAELAQRSQDCGTAGGGLQRRKILAERSIANRGGMGARKNPLHFRGVSYRGRLYGGELQRAVAMVSGTGRRMQRECPSECLATVGGSPAHLVGTPAGAIKLPPLPMIAMTRAKYEREFRPDQSAPSSSLPMSTVAKSFHFFCQMMLRSRISSSNRDTCSAMRAANNSMASCRRSRALGWCCIASVRKRPHLYASESAFLTLIKH